MFFMHIFFIVVEKRKYFMQQKNILYNKIFHNKTYITCNALFIVLTAVCNLFIKKLKKYFCSKKYYLKL